MANWLCSGDYSGGSGRGNPYIEIYYNVNSTNTTNMTSNVTVTLYGRRNGNQWSWADDSPGASLYVNGNGYGGSGNFDYTSGDATLIVATLNIQHNSSGAATLSVSGYHNSGVGIGSASCSGSVSLPNIASFISMDKTNSYWTNDDSAPYFKGTGSSTSGVSRVWIELNPVSTDKFYADSISDSTIRSGYSLTLSNEFKSTIWSLTTNTTSIPVRMGICKSGTESTGASYKDFVLNLAPSNPTFGTVSFTDTNSSIVALTGSSSKMIKGASTLTLSVAPATANKSGSMVSYTITPSGGSPEVVSASSNTITRTYTKATFSSITVTATDSRGWTSSTTKTLTESASGYFSPTVGSFLAVRNSTTSTTVNLSASGTWFNSSFGSQSNTLSAQWYYKQHSASSWNSGGTVTPTKSSNNWSLSVSKTGCTDNVAYDFKIILTDKITSVDRQTVTAVAQPAFKLYKDASSIDHAVLPLTTAMIEDSLGTKTAIETWVNNVIQTYANSFVPVGTIVPFAGSTIPAGWLECNGYAVSRTDYSNLFSVIGTTYGTGNGSSTFNLPNLQGKVITGVSSTDGDFDLGDSGGEKTHTLIENELPSISGYFNIHGSEGGTIFYTKSGHATGTLISNKYETTTYTSTSGANSYNYPGFAFGNDGAHNNLQPYLTTKYIIKADNSIPLPSGVSGGGSGSGTTWGSITGTLSNQTDLYAMIGNVESVLTSLNG